MGSTTALTDASRSIKEAYEYSPYGEIHSGDTSFTEFLYNGMYGVITDSNGLYYMRARYYNPTILRFINQDVVLGTLPDIQSLNRYAYCEGNPVSFIDPFGLCHEDTAVMHDIAWAVNTVAIVFDVLGVPVLGELVAAAACSFDAGLLVYDIIMDVKCHVESKVLISDICKFLLDVAGVVSFGLIKELSLEADLVKKGVNYMADSELLKLNNKLKYAKEVNKLSNLASDFEFLFEKENNN